MTPNSTVKDPARLEELRRLRIIDTLPEEAFDRVTRLAAAHLAAPVALVTLVDEHRQWYKACIGLDETETDVSLSFCAHTIEHDEVLVIPDATLDPRVQSYPNVTGHPHIRFYAGAPIVTAGGYRVGTVCVIDHEPRTVTEEQTAVLRDLAAVVARELEQRAMHERLGLLESVVVNANEAVIITDALIDPPGPHILYVNDAFTRHTGYTAEDAVGRTPRMLQGPRTDRADLDRIRDAMRAAEPIEIELLNYRKDGTEFPVQMSIAPVHGANGNPAHFIAIQRDVTRQRRQEATERGRREVLELVARGAPLPDALRATQELLEVALAGMTATVSLLQEGSLHEAVPSRLPRAFREATDGLRVGPGVGTCGAAVHERRTVITADILTDPGWRDFAHAARAFGLQACWSVPILSRNDQVLGTLAVYDTTPREPTTGELVLLEDTARLTAVILERYRALDEMQQLALYDPLTGLPNRVLFHEMLRQATDDAARTGQQVIVGVLDLDRFKEVNDTLGHTVGDELLAQVARRLQRAVPTGATVARMSGDEFTLVLPATHAQLNDVADALLAVFEQPFTVAGRDLYTHASLGFATYPTDAHDQDGLLSLADVAMYHAKRGNHGWAAYSAVGHAPDRRRIALETDLHRALAREELVVHYQPTVDGLTHRVLGAEALLRWQHPEFGLVPPGQFIPIAEASGLIVPIGEWLLHEVCAQAARWQTQHPGLHANVNLSAKQFSHPNLLGAVRSALHTSGLAPHLLILEITESVLMDARNAAHTLHLLRELGVQLAIDDFGTGYSSLAYLRSFPIHILKIDRSFISGVDSTDPRTAQIVRSVVQLAQSLGLIAVAEGVETTAQAEFLRGAGCDVLQGYLFSRPLPLAQLLEFLGTPGEPTPA